MSKAKGPLLSLSASGKFKDFFEIRAKAGTHDIIPIRRNPDHRSPAQENQANRFKTATTAWNTLDTGQKSTWNTAAQGTGKIGYRLYLSEYLSQGITPPGQPQVP